MHFNQSLGEKKKKTNEAFHLHEIKLSSPNDLVAKKFKETNLRKIEIFWMIPTALWRSRNIVLITLRIKTKSIQLDLPLIVTGLFVKVSDLEALSQWNYHWHQWISTETTIKWFGA